MDNKKNNQHVIVHKSCPDGCASAVLAKIIHPEIKIHFLAHQNINEFYEKLVNKIEKNGLIIFIDISCEKPFLITSWEKLEEKKINLKIFDHHETNKWLENLTYPKNLKVEINFNQEKSASYIFYEKKLSEHYDLKKYFPFIQAINDRDLWINQIKKGKELAKLHQCLGDKNFVERFLNNPDLEFSKKEEFILDLEIKRENKKNEYLLNKIEIKEDKNNLKYGVIYGDGNSSDLLNLAITKYNLVYAILINLHSKKGSIRSEGNFDCAQYAESLGGGGHKNAAGFKIKFDYPIF